MFKKIRLLLAMTVLFAACAEKSDGTVVRYMYWDARYTPAFEALKAEFEKENPAISIAGEVVPWAQYWAKIEAAVIGKDLPDVFWMNFPNFPRFQKENLFYDWEGNYGELSNMIPIYPESIRSVYGKGAKWEAFPKGMDTVAVFANTKLFQDAGVPLPKADWTYTDFTNTLALLKAKLPDGTYPAAFTDTPQGGYDYFIYNSGGYLVSPDGSAHGLKLPGTIRGIEEYRLIMNSDFTPPYNSLGETPNYLLFANGKVALVFQISVHIERFFENPELRSNIMVLPLPKLVNGQNRMILQAVGDAVGHTTKNPEAAKKWVEFMNSPKGLEIQAEKGIFFPLSEPYAGIFASKYINMDPFKDLNNTYSYPSIVEFSKYNELFNRTIRRIVEDPTLDAGQELSNAGLAADKLF